MRLTLSALLCASLISCPALARDHPGEPMMPPPGMDMPPPPPLPPPPGFDGPGYDDGYGAPMDPRRMQDRMRGEWMARCGRHHGHAEHADDTGPDRAGPDHRGPGHDGCRYPAPRPYGYGYGYPGAYMGYAVPMVMVPVLRSKPCPEVVEEWVEEVVPVRRRLIRPRSRAVPVVHDKRVRINDKRVPMTPSKRIAY
jgi:hypothetical protein